MLIFLGMVATCFLKYQEVLYGAPVDPMTVFYMWGGITGGVFGRGFNKKHENGSNGG